VRHAVLGNVGTLICFRLGAEDTPYFVREFVDEFEEIDLLQLPNYRIYIRLMNDGAPPSSSYPRDGPRHGRVAPSSCGSPGPTVRTPSPAPPACDRLEPARSFAGGIPAQRGCFFAIVDSENSKDRVSAKAGELHILPATSSPEIPMVTSIRAAKLLSTAGTSVLN
jgi:hypothetical protein